MGSCSSKDGSSGAVTVSVGNDNNSSARKNNAGNSNAMSSSSKRYGIAAPQEQAIAPAVKKEHSFASLTSVGTNTSKATAIDGAPADTVEVVNNSNKSSGDVASDSPVLAVNTMPVLLGERQEEQSDLLSSESINNNMSDSASLASSTKSGSSNHSHAGKKNHRRGTSRSGSAIGLDQLIVDRREKSSDLHQNIVHIEVPFGKPIEEVYDGVHSGPILGSGISGLVRLVTHKATDIKYAVKVLDLDLVETPEKLMALREEIFIMCQLDHPNIVRLEEVYESGSEIYLVQELCVGGELFDRLDEQPDYHYTEGECARLVKQMLCAVRYLHSKGIIHRDLKLENFLFSSTSPDSELKMIDFGLSKHFCAGEIQQEAVGTPYTVAPEVIRGSYDERCDLWAIGVIAFLVLSGDAPFGGCGGPESLMEVRSNILRGIFSFEPEYIWKTVSPAARQFIKSLLVTDPQQRPTARDAQKHQWLQEWDKTFHDMRTEKDNVLDPSVVKALVNFKEFSDMRKLLCEVLSFTLLPDQIKDLRREFEKMDTDGSGEISLAALKQVLMTNAGAGSLGRLTEEEVEEIFNAMRVRKTEARIHWHEFIAAGLSQCQVDDRNLRLAFDRLDSDHKGYITLDDLLDLMGSDALQCEEAMQRMWVDSVKVVQCQQSTRVTYNDFLRLMKGQSKETAVPTSAHDLDSPAEAELKTTTTVPPSFVSSPVKLQVVIEDETSTGEHNAGSLGKSAVMEGGILGLEPKAIPTDQTTFSLDSPNLERATTPSQEQSDEFMTTVFSAAAPLHASLGSPGRPGRPLSCPATPTNHRLILDAGSCGDSGCTRTPTTPHSALATTVNVALMPDVADDIGIPYFPLTPSRESPRVQDHCLTPSCLKNRCAELMDSSSADDDANTPNLLLSGCINLPADDVARNEGSIQNNPKTTPRFLESKTASKNCHSVADSVQEIILPERDCLGPVAAESKEAVADKDETKSGLVVNRKLYRNHRNRQIRLAVLEASKRFEEQQTRHAHEVIMAQRRKAGLVMRHGLAKQVSSDAIHKVLQDYRLQQQAIIEKSNRRGGRGRRSRKKTISDMSGMLISADQSKIGKVSVAAAATSLGRATSDQLARQAKSNLRVRNEMPRTTAAVPAVSDGGLNETGTLHANNQLVTSTAAETDGLNRRTMASSEMNDTNATESPATTSEKESQLRGATVPGEFRRTQDPFSKQGKYGAVARCLS